MDLLFKTELSRVPDLKHRLRQLRWFRMTFRSSVRAVEARYGMRFTIDDTRLASIFFDWVEAVNADKGFARVDRRDFIVYAAGVALRELISQQPLQQAAASGGNVALEVPEIVRFWPEGFVYTNYCVNVIAAMFEQEFGEAPTIDASADDLRTWWSYKENAREMPGYAIAYLDRFLGAEPNWIAPDMASARNAIRRALEQGANPLLPAA